MAILKVKDIYHDLHQMPEIGFQEYKTSAYLAAAMEALGYTVSRNVGETGVVAFEKGEEEGPVMLLRADMDALPFVVGDESVSIHACGHDAHCAMLLAAASVLKGKIRRGTLKFLFQPAEETLLGALSIIDAGVLDDVDIAVGLHIRPIQDIPFGTLCPGVKHSSTTFVKVVLNGRSAHASRPHLGVNTIEAAAAIINNIASIKMNPNVSWSCKPTIINGGGSASNIIPATTSIIFDIRSQCNEVMGTLLERFRKVVKSVAEAFEAETEILFPCGVVPAAILDEELTTEVAESIKKVVGSEKLMPVLNNTGGEDFHYFAYKYPAMKAAYFGVGVGAEPGLHTPDMHFNLDGLQNGVDVIVDVTLKKLG